MHTGSSLERQECKALQFHEFVLFKMEFIQPFKATNTAEFTLEPEGDGTVVTWSMYGERNFLGKAMGLILSPDKR
ncbi:hypothetical protein [Alteromonas antoniana]|uniref:hypothetical protein n=1 Tax=Alteromonas antoniana TaxID=2803813 RepID=UPI001C460A18|nr:hypothetical protein [Alteromonas antoniana]